MQRINIFILDDDPVIAAQMHLDKHVVKMCVESSLLASTAHRVLDGVLTKYQYFDKNDNRDKFKKHHLMPGETAYVQETSFLVGEKTIYEYTLHHSNKLYKSSHHKHPSELWLQQSSENYLWHIKFLRALFDEFTHRYGNLHSSESIFHLIKELPQNLPIGERTPFALAMPAEYKVPDAIMAYQNYYVHAKLPIARWTNRPAPDWFIDRVPKVFDRSDFERTC